ncbi:MAG: pilus assembly protein [Myxococcales bacterium]|nr:pilus assembly protein [Myxococcales bacterium]
MMRRLNRRGSAAIEFGLWIVILFGLLSAVVDWGRFMATRVAVARSAMDGARIGTAVFEPDDGSVPNPGDLILPEAMQRAQDVLVGMGYPCNLGSGCLIEGFYCRRDVTGACDASDGFGNVQFPPVDAIRIDVTYDVEPWFGFAFAPREISEEFVMAVESQRDN